MTDIIIAHYAADLDWLTKIDSNKYNIIIYRKDSSINEIAEQANIFQLPNYGWESLVYIYHIVKNYNSLSDKTFFLQDFPFDHLGNIPEIVIPIFNNMDKYDEYCNKKKTIESQYDQEFSSQTNLLINSFTSYMNNFNCSSHDRLFFGLQTYLRGHEDQLNIIHSIFNIPKKYEYFHVSSMFFISKSFILSKSLSFWNQLLDMHRTSRDNLCPRTLPYTLERCWLDIFDHEEML